MQARFRFDRNAVQVSAIYMLIGGLWILFSDRFAETLARNEQMLTTLSTYKGWFYVLVTGLLLYWLIYRNNSQIERDAAELQVAEKNYKEMFDHATVGIYRSAPDGRLLEANPKLASMFGYDSPEEMLASISDIGKQVYKDLTRREEYRRTIAEQGFIDDFVNEERRKDGSWIWTSTTARDVKDDAGNILYYEGFSTAVTESKQIQEKLQTSERTLKLFIEYAPAAIAMFDRDMKYIAASRRYFEDYRLPDTDIIGRSHYEIFPEIPARWKEIHKRCLAGATETAEQDPFPRADGTLDWVRWEILPWYEPSGVVGGVILFSEVITERKQMEAKLRKSEEQFREAIDFFPVPIGMADMQFNILYFNQEFTKSYGYTLQDLPTIDAWMAHAYPDPEYRQLVQRSWNERVANSMRDHAATPPSELDVTCKDGSGRKVEIVARVVGDLIIVSFDDITKRRRAEAALQKSQEQYGSLFVNIPISIAHCRMIFENQKPIDYEYIAVNPEFEKMTGLKDVVGKKISAVIPGYPQNNPESLETFGRVALTGKSEKMEHYLAEPGKWYAFTLSSPSQGEILIAAEDITERKLAEEKLLASETQYRRLFESAKDGILILDADTGEIVDVNPFLKEMLGYTQAEFLGKQLWEIGLFKDIVANKGAFLKLRQEGYVRYENLPLQTKDGQPAWVEFVSNVYDVGNKHVVQCNIRNITERKKTQELLSESEEKFRTLTEQSVDGIVLINEDGNVIEWNPAEEKITGIPKADAVGTPVWDIQYRILMPEHRAKLNPEYLKKVFYDSFQDGNGERLGKPQDIEILSVDGEHKFIQQTSFRIKTGKGNRIGSIFRDITKRRRAEKALSESEKHFHSLFDHMLEGYAYCEMIYENGQPSDFIYFEVNNAFEKLTGIKHAVGKKITQIIPDIRESNPELLEAYGRAARTGESEKLEAYVEALQTWFAISVYSVEKDRFVAVFDNITERKRTEESITESNRQLKALVTSLDDIVFEVGAQGTYLNVWTADESLLAEPKAKLLGTHIKDTLEKETADLIMEAIQRVLQANEVEEIEYSLDLRSGRHWFLARISPIASPDSSNQTVSMLVRDITERKAAQEAIRLRLAELELVHQSGLELSQVLEPEEIAQKLIVEMDTHLDWHHITIRLYDPESQTLKIIGYNVQGALSKTERQGLEEHFNLLIQKPEDGLTGWAVLHDQTLRIGDLKHDRRYTETFPGLNSGLYVPIKTDNRVLGVISVENEAPDAFSESDERLLNTLANQAAIALENSRLHKETQQQVKQLQALHSIDLAITNSLDLKITLDLLIHEAIEQSGADAAAIYLLRPDINNLEYLLSNGFRTYLLEKLRHSLSLNESLAGRAIRERRVIASQATEEQKSDLREIWEAEGFHSIYTFPLETKGEAKGVMKVFYRSEVQTRIPAWMNFLETLAGQAAIAIENIHLFDGLQRSNLELAVAYDATIEGWSRAMDLRDEETEGHTQRVTEVALKLAAEFGFSGEMLMNIRRGALLHDIGKLGVPDRILLKPDKLTDEEWVIMKKHPTFAFEMLAPIEYLNRSINIPYCHHEKWDGTGYPRGMHGEQNSTGGAYLCGRGRLGRLDQRSSLSQSVDKRKNNRIYSIFGRNPFRSGCRGKIPRVAEK